jgi:hypothetical protein
VPTAFVAVMVKEYVVVEERPLTVQLVDDVVHEAPPGEAVTV